MKPLGLIIAIGAVLYGLYLWKYPTYTYRYRMTVSVETPGGVRSGSSVIEVRVRKNPTPFGHGAFATDHAQGEAVFVDLGDNKSVVALLAGGEFAEAGAGYPTNVVPDHFKLSLATDAQLVSLPNLRGSWELARNRYPTFVTFADRSDPSTIRLVRADQFEATFGAGFLLRGVKIEMTKDAVTRDIESKLPWVKNLSRSTIYTTPGQFTLNGPYFKR